MPDAALPVNRFRQSLSRVSHQAAVLTSSGVAFDTSTVVPLRSSSCLIPDPVRAGPFPSAHTTLTSQSKPPKVVCSLLLQAGCEGPSFID
jgi:hypothetical protein